MANSVAKSSILALTQFAATMPEFSDWTYRPTGQRFLSQPVEGITVTLSPGWTFRHWTAVSQPYVTIESRMVSKAYRAMFGAKPDGEFLRFRYQQIWSLLGKPSHHPYFWEEFPVAAQQNDRLIDDVPLYLAELLADYTKAVLAGFDLTSEDSFLRSAPSQYVYHGHPMQHDLTYLFVRCMSGDTDAPQRYSDDETIPLMVRQQLRAQIEIMLDGVSSIPRL